MRLYATYSDYPQVIERFGIDLENSYYGEVTIEEKKTVDGGEEKIEKNL